ncbi:MAG: copper resistance CopC/CopD family protein [Gemmatimonadaceae bacterium]
MKSPVPRLLSRLVAGLVVAALLILAPALAFAHGKLKSSKPDAGAHLAEVPSEIRLTFTEPAELTFTRIDLAGPDGALVFLTPLQYADGTKRVVFATVRSPLQAGVYTVNWQMAGKDGHPVGDSFTFIIAPGAAGVATAETPVAPSAQAQEPTLAEHHDPVTIPIGEGFDAESPLYVAIRWATFTGLLLVIGIVAFYLFVLGFLRRKQDAPAPMLEPASRRAARVGLWVTAVLGVVALLRLYAQSYAMHGTSRSLDFTLIASMLANTVWGWGWLLQMAAIVLCALGFRSARQGGGTGWALAALGAVVLAFTPALSGHASSSPRLAPLAILADGIHVIGAAGWLGSLLVVVAVGIPAALLVEEGARGAAVADLFNAFSPTALTFAGMTMFTGVFAAWIHLGTVSALWQSQYGKILLLKLAILSLTAGTGAYNWLRVKPSLGNESGAFRIRRTARAELVIGVLVLIVTAILVATPTPVDMVVSR